MRAEEQLKETMSSMHLSGESRERMIAAALSKAEEGGKTARKPFYMNPVFKKLTIGAGIAAAAGLLLFTVLTIAPDVFSLRDRTDSTAAPDMKGEDFMEQANPVSGTQFDTDELVPTVASNYPNQSLNVTDSVMKKYNFDYSAEIGAPLPEEIADALSEAVESGNAPGTVRISSVSEKAGEVFVTVTYSDRTENGYKGNNTLLPNSVKEPEEVVPVTEAEKTYVFTLKNGKYTLVRIE